MNRERATPSVETVRIESATFREEISPHPGRSAIFDRISELFWQYYAIMSELQSVDKCSNLNVMTDLTLTG